MLSPAELLPLVYDELRNLAAAKLAAREVITALVLQWRERRFPCRSAIIFDPR
jgi:hypothetical protein